MSYLTLRVPVKTYIRKYIYARYGFPLTLNSSSVFSDVVLAMLLVPMPTKRSRQELDEQVNRYTDRLEIRVPFHMFYRVPDELTQHAIVRINRYFENSFNDELTEYADNCATFKGQDRQTAIEAFAAKYHIELEEDISFDALKKKDWRTRKDKEEIQQLSLPVLSPAPKVLRKEKEKQSLPVLSPELLLFQ